MTDYGCATGRSGGAPAAPLFAAALAFALLAWASPAGAQMTEEQLARIPAGPQPIKFSHQVHATDNQIPCQYCHVYARRSNVAGVPSVALCMGCHQFVATQLSEVKKLSEYWQKKEPIPWVRIHDVPDFVRFPHYRHVNAKNETYPNGVLCQTCHGPVDTMQVVQLADANFGLMGWCLACHLKIPGTLERKRATPEAPGSAKLMSGLRPDGRHRPNLTDCLTCHK
ncbi:MAG: cytochrome c3 family protein [Candidatus Lambdaproteobacteria bacterium]|nr:cytochrome c3 family protein [Candidatus Lambdaproteobacteria bacterium]